MTDRRVTPANDRVVRRDVADRFPDLVAVDGDWRAVTAPVADLRRTPDGTLDRQAVMGERFQVLEDREGWSFGTLDRDGYAGWIRSEDLGPDLDANYFVAARGSHLYPEPDMKREPLTALSFGARFRIVAKSGRFLETTDERFVPEQHLRPIGQTFREPVTVAQLFFGTPYLWGGNSGTGIDCSGLVQAALLACGIPCPGDSDMQEAALGVPAAEGEAPRRGDLYFWKGHVAFAVDGETLIHANAHHMAVAYEPIAAAIARIAAQGGGPVTARQRL